MIQFDRVKRVLIFAAKVIFGILLPFVIIIVIVFFVTIPFHTLSLWRMERAVASSIQHPKETNLVERFSFLGSRYIDDAECTYAAGEVRSTGLSKTALLEQYENTTVSIFGFAGRMPVYIAIIDQDILMLQHEPAGEWIYDLAKHIDTNEPNLIYYLVYLYEPSRSEIGDYRCLEREL